MGTLIGYLALAGMLAFIALTFITFGWTALLFWGGALFIEELGRIGCPRD